MSSKIGTEFKTPLQQRSRASLERVYSATNILLGEKDFSQVTIAEISKKAEVSVGSIYQRFGSKNQLLWTMYDAYLEEAIERIEQFMARRDSLGLEQRVDALILMICGLFADNRGVIKSLLNRYRQFPESVPELITSQIRGAYDNSAQFLLSDNGDERLTARAKFAVSIILSMVRDQIIYESGLWEETAVSSDEKMVQALRPAVMAILNSDIDL